MADELEPVCTCGTERVVMHGGFARCPHCDQGCHVNYCQCCSLLSKALKS